MPIATIPSFPDALSVRLAARSGTFAAPTAGLCPEQVQANLLVLPSKYASDFRGLCKRNPVSCPLLGENIAPGDPRLQAKLAEDSDIRRDAPGYNVWVLPQYSGNVADVCSYKNGKLIKGDVANVEEYWREDSVAFLSKRTPIRRLIGILRLQLAVHLRSSKHWQMQVLPLDIRKKAGMCRCTEQISHFSLPAVSHHLIRLQSWHC